MRSAIPFADRSAGRIGGHAPSDRIQPCRDRRPLLRVECAVSGRRFSRGIPGAALSELRPAPDNSAGVGPGPCGYRVMSSAHLSPVLLDMSPPPPLSEALVRAGRLVSDRVGVVS